MKLSIKYVSIFLINTCEIKHFRFTIFFCVVKKKLATILRNVKLKKIQIQILEIFINIEYFSTCQPQ